jgi:hypothetical protein
MERLKIMLGLPHGGTAYVASMLSVFNSTIENKHDVEFATSGQSGGNFNTLWAQALNAGIEGKITHFAMLHADLEVERGWLDILVEELEARGDDLISVVLAIKDTRGVTSSGIGDPKDPWTPYRRFTIADLEALPKTFGEMDILEAKPSGRYLLHNNGCWLADLRKPIWYIAQEDGTLPIRFEFLEDLRIENKTIVYRKESEDWFFSRRLFESGCRTCITSKVHVVHYGPFGYTNWGAWGTYQRGDEDTMHKWHKFNQTIK